MSRPVLAISFVFVASLAALLGALAGGGGTVAVASHAAPVISPGAVSFADIVSRVNAGVVHITVVEGPGRQGHDADDDEDTTPGDNSPKRGEGSGFVVDAQGYILTNHHLVDNATHIRVRLADKRELPGTVVGVDPN